MDDKKEKRESEIEEMISSEREKIREDEERSEKINKVVTKMTREQFERHDWKKGGEGGEGGMMELIGTFSMVSNTVAAFRDVLMGVVGGIHGLNDHRLSSYRRLFIDDLRLGESLAKESICIVDPDEAFRWSSSLSLYGSLLLPSPSLLLSPSLHRFESRFMSSDRLLITCFGSRLDCVLIASLSLPLLSQLQPSWSSSSSSSPSSSPSSSASSSWSFSTLMKRKEREGGEGKVMAKSRIMRPFDGGKRLEVMFDLGGVGKNIFQQSMIQLNVGDVFHSSSVVGSLPFQTVWLIGKTGAGKTSLHLEFQRLSRLSSSSSSMDERKETKDGEDKREGEKNGEVKPRVHVTPTLHNDDERKFETSLISFYEYNGFSRFSPRDVDDFLSSLISSPPHLILFVINITETVCCSSFPLLFFSSFSSFHRAKRDQEKGTERGKDFGWRKGNDRKIYATHEEIKGKDSCVVRFDPRLDGGRKNQRSSDREDKNRTSHLSL